MTFLNHSIQFDTFPTHVKMGLALQYLRMVATGAFRHGATAYSGHLEELFFKEKYL